MRSILATTLALALSAHFIMSAPSPQESKLQKRGVSAWGVISDADKPRHSEPMPFGMNLDSSETAFVQVTVEMALAANRKLLPPGAGESAQGPPVEAERTSQVTPHNDGGLTAADAASSHTKRKDTTVEMEVPAEIGQDTVVNMEENVAVRPVTAPVLASDGDTLILVVNGTQEPPGALGVSRTKALVKHRSQSPHLAAGPGMVPPPPSAPVAVLESSEVHLAEPLRAALTLATAARARVAVEGALAVALVFGVAGLLLLLLLAFVFASRQHSVLTKTEAGSVGLPELRSRPGSGSPERRTASPGEEGMALTLCPPEALRIPLGARVMIEGFIAPYQQDRQLIDIWAVGGGERLEVLARLLISEVGSISDITLEQAPKRRPLARLDTRDAVAPEGAPRPAGRCVVLRRVWAPQAAPFAVIEPAPAGTAGGLGGAGVFIVHRTSPGHEGCVLAVVVLEPDDSDGELRLRRICDADGRLLAACSNDGRSTQTLDIVLGADAGLLVCAAVAALKLC